MLVGPLFAGALILMIAALVIVGATIVVMVFYLLTLMRALEKCSPYNRTMTPGHVWLQLIPFFGFVWQFFVVGALSSSLKREYDSRRLPIEQQPGRSLGIAMCVTVLLTWIPYLGWVIGIAHLVLWIVYWVKISNYSRALDTAPRYAAGPPAGPYYQNRGGTTPPYGSPNYSGSGYGAQPYGNQPSGNQAYGVQSQAPSYLPPQQPQQPAPDPAQTSTAGWLSSNARAASKTCTACGAALSEGSAFCASCGTLAS
jgi:hypothetical protein